MDVLEGNKVYTIQPKGILIIGHLSQLADSRDKLFAFELFRQNQKDILIVTFDEVFERAEHILNAH